MDIVLKKCLAVVKKKLGIKPSPKTLVHSISLLQLDTDVLTKHRIAQGDTHFVCKKGCAHCCHLRVEVLPPEVFYIANHIKNLPQQQKAHLIQNLESHVLYSTGRVLADHNKACPFLTDNASCGIYAVRPHKCRSNLSKSVDSCISTRSPIEDKPLKVAHIKLALSTAQLYKNKNCVMHPTELGQGVLAAINDEQLEIRWAKGEQVFELLPEKIEL